MNSLQHHGIEGQKWGVRRYQNLDGTLTAAGRARYGYDGSAARALVFNSRNRMLRAKQRNNRIIEKYKNDDKAKQAAARNKAIDKKWADRDKYDRRTSTGKRVVQNLLLGYVGAEYYRDARARGNSRGEAFVEAALGHIVGNKRDKAKYGSKAY